VLKSFQLQRLKSLGLKLAYCLVGECPIANTITILSIFKQHDIVVRINTVRQQPYSRLSSSAYLSE